MVRIANDKGIRRLVNRNGNQYRITISEDRNCILVENLTVIDSCAMHILDGTPKLREHLGVANWEFVIEELVYMNYIK